MGWTEADLRNRGGAKPHKYNARKKEVDGILFDSTREAKRYSQLKVLARIGAIKDLELQPRFVLQEKFTDESGRRHRKMEYVGDFRYRELGVDVVEDCKGFQTEAFKLKWKLVIAKYPEIHFELWK